MLFGVGLVLVLAVVVWVGGDPTPDPGAPLSPDGTGPRGARATVLLLEELGAEVDVVTGVPDDGHDAALVLVDSLDERRRARVAEWAANGGLLVVADPRSPFTPPPVGALDPLGIGAEITVDAQTCDVTDLDEVERIRLEAGVTYEVPAGASSCFGDGEEAVVVDLGVGAGRLRAVGGPNAFTNAALDREDNAVLVARLFADDLEGLRIAFLVEDPALADDVPGGGDEGLADLVADPVRFALVQLVVAFCVYAWFRARRVGRPVPEPLPTPLAGSELVAAVGGLFQQERDPDRSAELLRDDLRRTLARRLALPPDAPVAEVVAAAERGGAEPDALTRALAGPPVHSGDELADLARTIDHTRREVLHEHT